MKRELFARYKKNKQQLKLLMSQLRHLYNNLEQVPVVSGKVTKSSDEFPYVEEHMTVQMQEPERAAAIRKQIWKKEFQSQKIWSEISFVDDYISEMPEGLEKTIMQMYYWNGMTQADIGEMLGYTQGRVAQIIRLIHKD